MAPSGYNGADEDEIMDKVFSKYSTEGKDHNGVKNGQKSLLKSTAPKAAGVILEAFNSPFMVHLTPSCP